jgi:UDP-glucuronate decarboxylase
MHHDDGRVVSNFVVQALQGKPITIYGSGEQTRSFCYVDDMIEGILKFMRTDDSHTGPLNLGNPETFTIRQLAELVLEMTSSKSELIFHPIPLDDPKRRQPDISKAEELLGWRPRTKLQDGLKQTIDYFEDLLSNKE